MYIWANNSAILFGSVESLEKTYSSVLLSSITSDLKSPFSDNVHTGLL